MAVFFSSVLLSGCELNLSLTNFFSACPEYRYIDYEKIALEDPHLVHGAYETGSQDSQGHTGYQLEEEAVEQHVEAEQKVTPIKTWNLHIRK